MSRLIDADRLKQDWLFRGYDSKPYRDVIDSQPIIEPERKWIPCSEWLPEEAYPVIVTWKNEDPASYYQYILGKHYVGVAHFKNGKWYWYSSVTEDVLMEYGKYESEEFDEAIQPIAWMPLPEPYKEEDAK